MVLLATIILFSCRKDEARYDEDIVIIQGQEDGEVGMQGHITDVDGSSLSGAVVTSGDQATETDEYGYFRFAEVSTNDGTAVISILKEGFLPQYKKVTPVPGQNSTFVRSSLISQNNTEKSFQSTVGGTLSGNDNHKITFQPNTIVFEDGTDYSGEVIFSSYYIDPTRSDLNRVMPGDLSAIDLRGDEAQLVSFGMLYGDLTSPNGLPLQIKQGCVATVELQIPEEIVDNAPSQIPLWSLDEISATWIQEGIAVKEGNAYIAEIDHFSFWNCDAPFPIVSVSGCAINQDGEPIANTTIFVSVPGLGVTRYCSTDRNGCFYGKFPLGEDMLIGVYNDCGDISTQAFGPFLEVADVGQITFDISEFGFSLEGKVLDCLLSPTYPGLVEITYDNNAVALFPTEEDGSLSATIFSCAGSQIEVRGINPADLVAGDVNTYDITPEEVNDLGNIPACGTVLDYYFRLRVNGEVQLFIDPVTNRKGSSLEVIGNNESFSANLIVDENDLSNPIKLISVFLSNGTPVIFWEEDCNDFINFESLESGGIGDLVEGNLSGTYQGITVEVEYRQILQNELTPITGRAWNDLNENGIQDAAEPPMSDVKVFINNATVNINTSTVTDENGEYVLYGSHLDVNSLEVEIPENYILTDAHVGTDDTVDSDFLPSGSGVALQILIQNPGDIKENNDAGFYIDPDTACDNFGLGDPCITGDGDLCKEIVSTIAGVNFTNIVVRQGGEIIQQTGPQTSPYELCDLSYNLEYNVTCLLDNGIECETNFKDIGTIIDSTFFYTSFVQCDPFIAQVAAIPNQNSLLGIEYEWSDGSSDDMVTMSEGETISVITTSTADGCSRTATYTLEKRNVAIGGVVWKDHPAGDPNVFDQLDTERVKGIKMQLYREDGTFITRFTTGESGAYQFYLDVPEGNYYILAFDIPNGLEPVDKEQGDPDFDSDFNANGRTDIFTISLDCHQIDNIDLGLR